MIVHNRLRITSIFGLVLVILAAVLLAGGSAQAQKAAPTTARSSDGKASFSYANGTTSASAGKQDRANAGLESITQNSSLAVTPSNSVSCNNGVGHTDNSYYRAFQMSSYITADSFTISSVDIGIETASSGNVTMAVNGAGQPIIINLYKSTSLVPTIASMGAPIASAPITITDQAGTLLNVPIAATVNKTDILVLEIHTPDGQVAGNLFYIGSNSAPESGPGYISAAECGITEPTSTTAIGFPNMHEIMVVNGLSAPTCENVAWTHIGNVTASSNNLTKNSVGGWNGGAASTRGLISGNGYAQTTVTDLKSYEMFGLSNLDPDQGYRSIEFAIYTFPQTRDLIIYEHGVQVARIPNGTNAASNPNGGFPPGYNVGDVLRVELSGGVVNYYRNNVIIYSSTNNSRVRYPLFFDSTLNNVGAKLSTAQICGTNLGQAFNVVATPTPIVGPLEENVVFTNTVNVNKQANSLIKTTMTGWNGGAVSTRAIYSGDGYASAFVQDLTSYYMFGLSNGDKNQIYTDIDFALYAYPNTNDLLVYEAGHMKTRVAGYATGDTLKVAVESGVVKYYRNSTVIYTSSLNPLYPLLIDDSLNAIGSKLYNVKLGGTDLAASSSAPSASGLNIKTTCATSFSDVTPDAYFNAAVHSLACAGAVSGYSDGTFRPYAATTRGQLLKMLALANGWELRDSPTPTFSDVDFNNPFYKYIETAAAWHVISGYADGTFRPNAPITRGQLAKVIISAMAWPVDTTGGSHFADVTPDSVFYQYVETAYHSGLISGYTDGSFKPGAAATRGQIAKIVDKAVNGE